MRNQSKIQLKDQTKLVYDVNQSPCWFSLKVGLVNLQIIIGTTQALVK